MTRTTPEGTWTYVHVAPTSRGGPNPKTTVTDPQGNNTVYTFYDGTSNLQTLKQVYTGSISSAHLALTVITCYNDNTSTPTNCKTTGLIGVVTQKDVYTTYPGVSGYSAVKTSYSASTGLVTDVKVFDFNATIPTREKVIAYGTGNPTSQTCTAISTFIVGKPCSITLLDSQNSNAILSQSWNAYDSNGNLTQTWDLVSGSGATGKYLTKHYTYANGILQTSTDVNGQVTNYTTTSCNNMFVTSQFPQNFASLTTSQTWDCVGGVVTSSTGANNQTTHTVYASGAQADPFYRPIQNIDEIGNITSLTYTPTSLKSSLPVNGGASVSENLSTTDSIGRPVVAQVRQAPGGQWDSRSHSFDSAGRPFQTSLPCVSNTAGVGCSPSTESQTYDGLNRPLVHTGPAGDTATKTYVAYVANDVRTTLTPAPAGENAKAVQKEFDGLGQLKSVCLISNASGSGSCGQANGERDFSGFTTTTLREGSLARSTMPKYPHPDGPAVTPMIFLGGF